jgi:hypothetical protein
VNPFKYIWLVITTLHRYVMYLYHLNKAQKEFDNLLKTLNTKGDIAVKEYPVDPSIEDPVIVGQPAEFVGKIEKDGIWFNQN